MRSGTRPVTFRKMNVRDNMRREAEIERQRALTLAAFPELKKLDGQPGFMDHPDYAEFAGQVRIRTEYFPWLLAACNEPLSADDLIECDWDELLACCVAVRRLNPSQGIFFPRDVQIRDEAEKAEAGGPN